MSKATTSSLQRSDYQLHWALSSAALLSSALLFAIAFFVLIRSWPALKMAGLESFVSGKSWYPLQGLYNLTPMLAGSALVTLGATLVATPIALLSALFCHAYAPAWLARIYRLILQLLAGIPSVIFGFWGLVVLVPLLSQWYPPGSSLLTGILILTLMILPTIALLIDSALDSAPLSLHWASQSLALSPWTSFKEVMLPQIRSSVYTAILLGSGRALGETMAVLMVTGNVTQIPNSIFAPVRTLTANIALEMAYAMDMHQSALFVSGLLLFMMVMALVCLAAFLSRRSHVG